MYNYIKVSKLGQKSHVNKTVVFRPSHTWRFIYTPYGLFPQSLLHCDVTYDTIVTARVAAKPAAVTHKSYVGF